MRYTRNNVGVREVVVMIVLVAAFVVLLYRFTTVSNNVTVRINKKVESINGTVLSIETAKLLEKTPFLLGKNERAYKFTYQVDGEVKEGWVKRGFRYKWLLDYQK